MLGAASGGAFAIFRLNEKYDQTPAMLLAPIGLLLWGVGWSFLLYPLIRRIHWLLRLPAIAILVPVIPIGLIVVSVLILLGFMGLSGLL
jgi:hypothetical protein